MQQVIWTYVQKDEQSVKIAKGTENYLNNKMNKQTK